MLMAAGLQLSRGNLTEEDARLATRIVTSGQRMARMIEQLVEFTRVRLGGGFDLNLAPADLGEICRDIADELNMGSSAEVHQTADGDVSGTWDADRLAAVISNIAGNAIDHATPGTPVTIHGYGDGGGVVVEITNQGACIPPEVLPVIFKAFRRANVNANRPGGHLGLGLYISCEIVRAHGGTLKVESSDGSTTFTMRLPRVPIAAPRTPSTSLR
jgi:signal transduction histidine kinase